MASPDKKGEPLENPRGRPRKGALCSYPEKLTDLIKELRESHEGWGATNILYELIDVYGYKQKNLPGEASINRYLKEHGFIPNRAPIRKLPATKRCGKKARRPHDLWEMDAKGTINIPGVGYQAMINIKDIKSKIHCIAFPVSVKNKNTQPSTLHYYWALRLAFVEWGLPKVIQVDKDSVFYESRSRSKFPKILHLWLISLGIELCFINQPPPYKNAIVERSHQTMVRQVNTKRPYKSWKSFFQYCNNRRKRLNERLPNRMLGKKTPLEACPKAAHNSRTYALDQEEKLIDINRVGRYLAKCAWYRKVSSEKTLRVGGKVYYLKNAAPLSQLEITFSNRTKKLIFRDANEQIIDKQPMKNLALETLMGGNTKSLISTRYKLGYFRDFPLKVSTN